MGKIGDLSVNIDIEIGEETVTRCCQLLSMYLTDNPNRTIEVNEWEDWYNGDKIMRKTVSIGSRVCDDIK